MRRSPFFTALLAFTIYSLALNAHKARAASGSIDLSFGSSGKAQNSTLSRVGGMVLSSSRILLGGARWDGSGSLDNYFAGHNNINAPIGSLYNFGIVVSDKNDFINALESTLAGTIAAGVTTASNNTTDFLLLRVSGSSFDFSFGSGGKVITNISTNSRDYCYGVTGQTDGKILAVGSTTPEGENDSSIALVRYNSDGSQDSTFGIGGKVVTTYQEGYCSGKSVAVQRDGKIVVGGELYIEEHIVFLLLRYNTDGSIDTTFGTDGRVTTQIAEGISDNLQCILIQHDGKILAAGSSLIDNVFSFALARYRQDGSLDPTFATGGKALTDFSGSSSRVTAMALQSDGRILLCGKADDNIGLARFLSDGSLDTTFGTTGKVVTDAGNGHGNSPAAVGLQSSGKIVVGGISNSNTTLIRFLNSLAPAMQSQDASNISTTSATLNGSADPNLQAGGESTNVSFEISTDGILFTPVTAQISTEVVTENTSDITATVTDLTPGTHYYFRIKGSNSIGTSYGGDFEFTTLSTDSALASLSLSNAPLSPVFAGDTLGYSAAVPYLTTSLKVTPAVSHPQASVTVNGSPVTSGTASGNISLAVGSNVITTVVTAQDGSTTSTYTITVTRALPAPGEVDLSFTATGKVISPVVSGNDYAYSLAVQSDGMILLAGTALNAGTNDFALLRYGLNGQLDSSFGNSGKVLTPFNGDDQGRSVVVQTNGRIIVAGYTGTGSSKDFALARYQATGAIDSSFGNAGKVITDVNGDMDEISSVILLADGRIVAAGRSWNGNNWDVAMVCYKASGSLDNNFGVGGKVISDLNAASDQARCVLAQEGGRIYVAGYSDTDSGNFDFMLLAYTLDGVLDTTFGTGGKATTGIGSDADFGCSAALQTDGKIIVAGYAEIGSKENFALARFQPDGSLDTGFGNGGKVNTTLGHPVDNIAQVVVQNDGKILVAGATGSGSINDFALARYDGSGALDNTFGSGGKVVLDIAGNARNDQATALALQSDGKILAAGYAYNGSNHDFALVRLNNALTAAATTLAATSVSATGATLNGSINPNGKATTAFFQYGTSPSYGTTVAVELTPPDGTSPVLLSTSLTDLAPNTLYYYRMVAQTDEGPTYGSRISFITPAPDLRVYAGPNLQSPEITDSENTVDYGSVAVEGGQLTRTFTLFNGGSAPLNLTATAPSYVTLSGSSDFSVTIQPASPVGIGSTATFAILFNPSSFGPKSATVSIANDDADENPYTFIVQGNGAAAGTLSFTAQTYVAHQGDTGISITVQRSQGDLPCSVAVRTQDGTALAVPPFAAALADEDYTPRTGQDVIVTFAENDTAPKNVQLILKPQTGTATPNKRFTITLSDPSNGGLLGQITSASIRILAADDQKPSLTVNSPASGSSLSGPATYLATGTANDKNGIERVEVSLNDGEPVLAEIASSTNPNNIPWSLEFAPLPNVQNTLVVTAYDLRGNSFSVTRSFTYILRSSLTLYRQVPAPFAAQADKIGTVSLATSPVSAATKLAPTMANADPKTSSIIVGTLVKLTAIAKTGYVFSGWLNPPSGAIAQGNVLSFTMPNEDISDLAAQFIESPFTPASGKSSPYFGLLQDTTGTPGNDNTGFITGTLTAKGSFSGKILIGGLSQSFTATFYGDGSAVFGNSKTSNSTLSFKDRSLSLSMDMETSIITAVTDTCTGSIHRALYSTAQKVPAGLLNSAKKGFYTFGLPAKVQTPPVETALYPQGYGYGSLKLSDTGSVSLAVTLADGTVGTASTALITDDACPFLIPIRTIGASASTKGSSFSGNFTLSSITDAEAPPATTAILTATDLDWFRAPALGNKPAALLYTSGWPLGIEVDAFGSLYNTKTTAQNTLGLSGTGLNALLTLKGGRLTADLILDNLNITGNKVTKVPAKDPSFTLTLKATTGTFQGNCIPNWLQPARSKPAFKGILIQKGGHKGGYGFFISNATNDPDPESGSVTLGAP